MSRLRLKLTLAVLVVAIAATSTDARRRHYYRGFFLRQNAGEAQERRSEDEQRAAPRPPAASFGAIVAEITRGCAAQAAELEHWPYQRIAEIAAPDEAQRRALDALHDAALAGAERLAADCPPEVAPALAARLDAADRAIEAVTAALDAVHPALRDFYAALDDEQKARLYRGFGMGEAAAPADMRARRRGASESPAAAAAVPWSALCERLTAALRDWPGKRIEREMRLSDAQRGALYELFAAALKAADSLAADCPAETALTPARRMQTLRARLLAITAATAAIRPALSRFNDALDSDQQQRFAQMN
jgi:hypothetical protein